MTSHVKRLSLLVSLIFLRGIPVIIKLDDTIVNNLKDKVNLFVKKFCCVCTKSYVIHGNFANDGFCPNWAQVELKGGRNWLKLFYSESTTKNKFFQPILAS